MVVTLLKNEWFSWKQTGCKIKYLVTFHDASSRMWNSTMKKSLAKRRHQVQGTRNGTSTFSENCYIVWISTKIRYMISNPPDKINFIFYHILKPVKVIEKFNCVHQVWYWFVFHQRTTNPYLYCVTTFYSNKNRYDYK